MYSDQYVYAVEVTAYDPSLPGTRVLYYCTHNFATTPTDTPASTIFTAAMVQPALITRSMFSDGTTMGRATAGYGEVVLSNNDGSLDALLTYGLDGRSIVIRRAQIVDASLPAYPSGWTPVLSATMDLPDLNVRTLTLRLRDNALIADTPIQSTRYLGSNSLPNGLEGVADLAGKPKPLIFGSAFNLTPYCVNTSKLIYQYTDGAGVATTVYDRGVALTNGGSYATLADLQNDSLAPSAGQFKYYNAGGYVRLGSSPAGTVTMDATSTLPMDAGQAFTAVITSMVAAGLSVSARVGDAATLSSVSTGAIGLWIAEERTFASVLDEIANSVGAWWGIGANGEFRIKRLDSPTGSPVVTFTEVQVTALERVSTTDPDRGLPSWRVVLQYKINYTAQSASDLAASVSDARRSILRLSFSSTPPAESSAILTTYKLARQLLVRSLLVLSTDAGNEATRLFNLRSVRRDRFTFRVPMDSVINTLDLGDIVSLEHSRFNLSAGKLFAVIGLEPDAASALCTITVWG